LTCCFSNTTYLHTMEMALMMKMREASWTMARAHLMGPSMSLTPVLPLLQYDLLRITA
jgi:hypothetical protein